MIKLRTRRLLMMAVIVYIGSVVITAQESSPPIRVSPGTLTAEQVAIYRTVIKHYLNGGHGRLNIASTTEPVGRSHPFFDQGCLKEIGAQPTRDSATVVHRLDSLVAGDSELVLVDPDRQEKRIQQNDPQNLIKKAVDDHEKVTDKELDASVEEAFRTGLFTLSEIVFDKQHRNAVVAYSFVCGGLCGNGNTLVVKRVGQRWKISKACGGWVS